MQQPSPVWILVSAVAVALHMGGARASWADALSLDACVAAALQRNPGIRIAEREVEAARARVRQAGALEPPSLSSEGGQLGLSASTLERESAMRLSQDLPFPGQRGSAVRVARTEVGLAEANRESFVLKLRGDVTRAYRRLQADVLNVHTLEGLRSTATDFEQMVGIRLRSGGARYLDVLRARAERTRIENDLIEAERSLRENRRALNTLMARALEEPLEPADSLAYAPLTDSLSVLLNRARASRPRLQAARLEVERGLAQVKLARTGLLPSGTLSVGLDRIPGEEKAGFGGELSLSLPFAPWTDRRARVGEARAVQGSAQARLEAAERELEAIVRNAYETARSTERQVQQFDRVLLADAQDALRAAVQNYQAGQIDGLELFETLRTFRTIQLEHVRALLNYEIALNDLAVAE